MQFSILPRRLKHAWLYFALFLMAGIALMPMPLTGMTVFPLLSGVCIGIAAMIAMFMLGKKAASEVE